MNPDPAVFVFDLQDANKKNYRNLKKKFFCLLPTFWRYIYIIFQIRIRIRNTGTGCFKNAFESSHFGAQLGYRTTGGHKHSALSKLSFADDFPSSVWVRAVYF
jgi:hypothetical protein